MREGKEREGRRKRGVGQIKTGKVFTVSPIKKGTINNVHAFFVVYHSF